ncbi:MAG: tetratricopeptide repeat protein [Anaerolineales bacterium]|nr:tetratricopeptide repeat protein [Anaerolineales bacterium]
MGFLKGIFGKDLLEYEQKGDSLFEDKSFGDAKLEYEAGLHKLEKKDPDNSSLRRRLEKKTLKSKEALAFHHKQRGEELMESQVYEEAEDIFRLALELTENPELKSELQKQLKEIQGLYAHEETIDSQEIQSDGSGLDENGHSPQYDEYFAALCGSFSDKEREKAYYSYGDTFIEGYLALNQGYFELAAAKLSQSMEENPSLQTYIPMELATAYLNLERVEEAKGLLTSFVKDFPDSLQGYQLLCEAFWEMKAYEQAQELLETCPQQLVESPFILLLRGETLFQAGKFQEAKTLFRDYLQSDGWNEEIGLSLARTHEALDEKEDARDLYGKIMEECSGCGKQVAPIIKQKYSDISLECGQCSTTILELYLGLVQEDPDNKKHYYQKIIEIYSALGDEKEARRYQSIADGM